MKKDEIEYSQKDVVLSREYHFGKTIEIDVKNNGKKEKKKVTQLTIHELTGFDDELIDKQVNNQQLLSYVQVSISCGITYDDTLSLATKDMNIIMKALTNL